MDSHTHRPAKTPKIQCCWWRGTVKTPLPNPCGSVQGGLGLELPSLQATQALQMVPVLGETEAGKPNGDPTAENHPPQLPGESATEVPQLLATSILHHPQICHKAPCSGTSLSTPNLSRGWASPASPCTLPHPPGSSRPLAMPLHPCSQ